MSTGIAFATSAGCQAAGRTMRRSASSLAMIACALLAGCAGVEQKRDTENEARISSYLSTLGRAAPLSVDRHCSDSMILGRWATFELDATTPIANLPSGPSSAVICIRIPAGSEHVRIDSDPTGGVSYFGMTIVRPSIMFLDDSAALVRDVPVARMHVGQGALNKFGLTGEMALAGDLAEAMYILVYVHPASLESGIDVNNGFGSMWVPYSPYGSVRLNFSSKAR